MMRTCKKCGKRFDQGWQYVKCPHHFVAHRKYVRRKSKDYSGLPAVRATLAGGTEG